ncbi:hypothetical protein FHW79_005873 [Azospirillum sp. OGB3]|uniref:hypothetical protein n=1 Tax=Azospirillum sp. OGB3 TaxID=2587012 RepID=UPI001820388F|nr:hypothetical protein [Azospirillum sp. OGB3]MBB3268198.1 hypothetical protein [Azospirillum sp. OGB3]
MIKAVSFRDSAFINKMKILISLLIVAAASALVFGLSFNYGFEWGDVGSYAQTVYEIHRGAVPGDFVGYGVLWYAIGVAVFKVTGVNYTAILLTLHAVIGLVACLLFLGTWLATRRVWVSLLVAVIFILVPPFTASAVRSLSLGLNLVALVLLARAPVGRGGPELLAASAAVGITFMLRPDFGYFFVLCLWGLLVLRCWYADGTGVGRLLGLLRSSLLMAAAIAATMAPLFIHASLRGYLPAILDDYLTYPRRIAYFILESPSLSNMAGGTTSDAGFLRILPVSALFGSDNGDRVFAFLIYSTMLALAAFAAYVAWRWIRRPGDARENLLNVAVLLIAGSQWPIFALFRPGWIHFATFMHAYLLLAAVAAVRLMSVLSLRTNAAARAASWAALFVLAAQAGLFVLHGVQVPGVGVLAQRQGRDARMSIDPGIDVMVSTAEKQQYETINRIIRANSGPDDRIVCVPYCPGYAFMAERRMLFKEHYVDDNTPNIRPGWIDQAIGLTDSVRPPVIIVQDWAPNETEASRFVVWAARYMDVVRERYRTVVPIPGGSAYILEQAAGQGRTAKVKAYGPTATPVNVPFNQQPDGSSALWLSVPGLSGAAQVRLDGVPLASAVAGDVVSALVPADRIAAPGRHWLEVVDPAAGLRTEPVPFDVTSP